MKKFRSYFRKFACAAMLIILVVAGYNITLKCLYPLHYSEYVEKYSEEYGVNRELVYAVIKSESNFHADARSAAGASGLMQLTEETFNDVKQMLGDDEEIRYEDCWNDAETNIKYGTRYLKYLFEIFKKDKIAVLAAYNAGMGNVIRWMDGGNRLDESDIQFAETEGYVDRVLRAEKYYDKLYD